jgi:hypothetical protein
VITRFSWNQHIEQELKRIAAANLTPRYRAALEGVRCPDHDQSPTISEQGIEWRIERCCERAERMAFEAIRSIA